MGCISILRSSRYTVCPFPFLHVLVPLEMLSECRNCTIHCTVHGPACPAAGPLGNCCWWREWLLLAASSGKSHADLIIGNTLDTQWFEWWTNAFIESTATIYRDFWFRLVIIYSTSAALQKHCTQLQGCRLLPVLSTATDWLNPLFIHWLVGDTSMTRGTWHVRVTSRQGRICTWTWLWAGARVWQHRPCPVSAGGGCCC